jgi:hypothetical protein
MQSAVVFIGAGPDLKRGIVVPAFSNVHVYSLLARLLQVTPAVTDGSLDSVRTLLNQRR